MTVHDRAPRLRDCRRTAEPGAAGFVGWTFGFFEAQERRDMHDLVEWAAAQPWSDGNVGMLGISYFAMTQLEAAVEQPPHLEGRCDPYGAGDLNPAYSPGFRRVLASPPHSTC
jgi:X-Pro dipeptidyl-peptidase (S15 family)